MISRVLAIIFGVIAGAAALAAFYFAWGEIVALIPVPSPDVAAALSVPVNRLAWAITGSVTVFAAIALLTVAAGGIVETTRVRRRLAESRIELAGSAGPRSMDWPAIFAQTAIAGPAAASLDPLNADPAIFLSLEAHWSDRLTFGRTIAPLPKLVLAADATLAILGGVWGTGWELALAAGAAGWFAISLARYLAVIVVTPFVAWTMDEALSALRPAIAASGIQAGPPRRGPGAIFQPAINQPLSSPASTLPAGDLDPGAIARDIAALLADPIERLAEAADRLGPPPPASSREQAVDAALAEIRAGIERLLSGR